MKTDDLEPLGGIHEGRLWPLTAADISAVEGATGWTLPEDYREFVTTWGASRPIEGYWTIDCGPDEVDTIIDMFMGAAPDRSVSVVEMASDYLDPLGLLVFARADNGLFFLAPSGKVLFERAGNPVLHEAAVSFESFFDQIRFHGEEL